MSNSLDPVMSSQIFGPNCFQKLSADYTTPTFKITFLINVIFSMSFFFLKTLSGLSYKSVQQFRSSYVILDLRSKLLDVYKGSGQPLLLADIAEGRI